MTGPVGWVLDPQRALRRSGVLQGFPPARSATLVGQIRVQAFKVPASLRNTDVPLIIRGAAPIGHDKLAGAMKI